MKRLKYPKKKTALRCCGRAALCWRCVHQQERQSSFKIVLYTEKMRTYTTAAQCRFLCGKVYSSHFVVVLVFFKAIAFLSTQ